MIWRRTQPREHQLAEGLSRHVFDGEASQQLTMANAHILCHCRVSGQSLYRGVVGGGGAIDPGRSQCFALPFIAEAAVHRRVACTGRVLAARRGATTHMDSIRQSDD